MPTLSVLQTIAVWAIPLLLAITLHESAHAFVASLCGDNTAKRLGRLSINPLRHIDPIGTILVPLVVAVLSQFQFVFGWAKPVPINWAHLKQPRRDSALIGAAGPLANVIMAFLWAIALKISTFFHPETSTLALYVLLMAKAGILINLVLALLNMIPIPPLDGSRVIASLLSPRQAVNYSKLERYGFFILILLLFSGILNLILSPLLMGALHVISSLFNL